MQPPKIARFTFLDDRAYEFYPDWGFVDEVSMILAPIANGDDSAPRFFTAKEPYSTVAPFAFDLKSVENLGDSVIWLRYVPQA